MISARGRDRERHPLHRARRRRITSRSPSTRSCCGRGSAACLEKKRRVRRLRAGRRGTGRSSSASREKVAEVERLGRLQAVLLAAARRADRGRRRRGPAQDPPPRDHGGVPRPARLHRVRRDGRARRGHGRAPRVPRRDGRADPRARGHARAVHRRRDDDLLQRPGARCPTRPSARSAWRSRCGTGCSAERGVAQARLRPRTGGRHRARATRRSAPSASRAGGTTAPSAP